MNKMKKQLLRLGLTCIIYGLLNGTQKVEAFGYSEVWGSHAYAFGSDAILQMIYSTYGGNEWYPVTFMVGVDDLGRGTQNLTNLFTNCTSGGKKIYPILRLTGAITTGHWARIDPAIAAGVLNAVNPATFGFPGPIYVAFGNEQHMADEWGGMSDPSGDYGQAYRAFAGAVTNNNYIIGHGAINLSYPPGAPGDTAAEFYNNARPFTRQGALFSNPYELETCPTAGCPVPYPGNGSPLGIVNHVNIDVGLNSNAGATSSPNLWTEFGLHPGDTLQNRKDYLQAEYSFDKRTYRATKFPDAITPMLIYGPTSRDRIIIVFKDNGVVDYSIDCAQIDCGPEMVNGGSISAGGGAGSGGFCGIGVSAGSCPALGNKGGPWTNEHAFPRLVASYGDYMSPLTLTSDAKLTELARFDQVWWVANQPYWQTEMLAPGGPLGYDQFAKLRQLNPETKIIAVLHNYMLNNANPAFRCDANGDPLPNNLRDKVTCDIYKAVKFMNGANGTSGDANLGVGYGDWYLRDATGGQVVAWPSTHPHKRIPNWSLNEPDVDSNGDNYTKWFARYVTSDAILGRQCSGRDCWDGVYHEDIYHHLANVWDQDEDGNSDYYQAGVGQSATRYQWYMGLKNWMDRVTAVGKVVVGDNGWDPDVAETSPLPALAGTMNMSLDSNFPFYPHYDWTCGGGSSCPTWAPFGQVRKWDMHMNRYIAWQDSGGSLGVAYILGADAGLANITGNVIGNGTAGSFWQQEYEYARFVLGSALLDNGYALTYGGQHSNRWCDECGVVNGRTVSDMSGEDWMGCPVDVEAVSMTDGATMRQMIAAGQGARLSDHVWKREFSNALVLVNPTSTSQTVNVVGEWYRILGVDDPVHNNGMKVTGSISIDAMDAFVLTGQGTPAIIPYPVVREGWLHPGIDIKPSSELTSSTMVYSTHAGFVTYAGPAPLNITEKGWLVQIESDLDRDNVPDIVTRYTHLAPNSLMINDVRNRRTNYTTEFFLQNIPAGMDKLPYGYGPYVTRNQLLGYVGDTGSPGRRHIQYEVITDRYIYLNNVTLATYTCLDDPYVTTCAAEAGRPGYFFPVLRKEPQRVKAPVYTNGGFITPYPTP